MTPDELLALNPFPGLRPFTASDADRFFGRQQQIDELVELLTHARLVGVAGASGCGKSSLVLAGLTSELARRRNDGGELEWRPVVMRPGNHSIANLSQALASALGMAGDDARTDALYGRLALGSLGLADAIRAARLAPHVRVLVIVDQFEEIFRFRQADPEEPSAFVKLLLTAVQDPDTPIGVVLTLRSSELGKCADFADLAEAVSRGQYLVPKLTRDQRKEAIQKPVEQAGFRIAPSLVQRILNDVSDDFDDLPVMQHVLSRTWQHWARASGGGRPINLDDYVAVGTAASALSNHADEAYESLPGLQPLVEKVFRALTERVDGAIENRRPLDFDRLCAVTGADPADVAKVVERFRRPDTAFLMPPPSVPLSTNPVIDISHESLIRQWQRLRDWARAEADSRSALIRILQSARRHENDEGDLARGRDLERMLAWRNSVELTPAWVELYAREDGTTGRALVERFLGESAAEAERARRRKRIQVWSLRALALAIVIAGWSAAAIGLHLHRQSTSRELAAQALLELDRDPARGAHFALAAFEQDRDNAGAELALRQALATLETARTEKIIDFHSPILAVAYTADRSRLVVTGTQSTVIYDAADIRKLYELPRADGVAHYLLADNASLLSFTTGLGGSIRRLGSSAAEAKLECPDSAAQLGALTVSAHGRSIAGICKNGELVVWELDDGGKLEREVVAKGKPEAFAALAGLSSDAALVATADAAGVLTVWNRGKPGHRLRSPEEATFDRAYEDATFVEFDADNPTILATQADTEATPRTWQVDFVRRRVTPASTADTFTHERKLLDARFVPSAGKASTLMTISEKRVRFWRDGKLLRAIHPHDDNVTDAEVSDDGRYLATASVDGNAALTSAQTGQQIALLRGHRDSVRHVAFGRIAQEGEDTTVQVVTASDDRTLRVWRIRPPRLLASGDDFDWKLSARFDPSGRRIVYCGYSSRSETPCSVIDAVGGQSPDSARRPLLPAESGSARAVSWSHDGRWIAARINRSTRLWDAQTAVEKTPAWLKKSRVAVFGMPAPVLVTMHERNIRVWDAAGAGHESATPRREIASKLDAIGGAVSPDGRWIAAFARQQLEVWDTRPDPPLGRLFSATGGAGSEARAHAGAITEVRFSGDSRLLVSASADRTARVWAVETGKSIELAGHNGFVMSAGFSPDNRYVVTASADKTIAVWDAGSGRRLGSMLRHTDEPNQVEFAPNGTSILSASDDSTVKLGRCEACLIARDEIEDRAMAQACVRAADLLDVRAEIERKLRYFTLPGFLRASARDTARPKAPAATACDPYADAGRPAAAASNPPDSKSP